MTSSEFRCDRVPASRDSIYSEAINRKMHVPDRLRVGPGVGLGREEERQWRADRPASYNMHIPDRLSFTDAPDMSPHSLFTSSNHGSALPLGNAWDTQQHTAWIRERDPYLREPVQSPMRRSYSDQFFGRNDPVTPASRHSSHTLTSAMQDSWMSTDDEGSAAVEFIVLRRQVLKMSRRLAGLERQNAERRQTELVIFSLLVSACLLNGWLWIRR
ncbi:hypothetical protein DPEC_G00224700 [Dallia pectoralis]|uniref:Uncharacterized protein n=1 Tax=Dallia pectoralis TaxID=75939 RepID=A0ACC2G096_DALPE|nr:hypothetical protein DPEC_G00224700 [Dallia pectoralis]